MKIGLFGGTFNPFHKGHIGIIEYVKKLCSFDKIFLIPSATPPHKPDLNLAPAQDRYDMVQGSIKNHKGMTASDKEILRQGASFTIDTIRIFKEELGDKAELFFLMGSDAFLDIDTWKQKDSIFDEIKVIIMLRCPSESQYDLSSFIRRHISDEYKYHDYDPVPGFIHPDKLPIYICKVPPIDISSTLIRERISQDKSVEELVPPEVLTIIKEKGLYK